MARQQRKTDGGLGGDKGSLPRPLNPVGDRVGGLNLERWKPLPPASSPWLNRGDPWLLLPMELIEYHLGPWVEQL